MKATATRVTGPHRVPRQGEIHSNTIPTLFHDLSSDGATGILTVTDREIRKSVQLGKGTILFASSTDRDDRFIQLLLKSDVLPLPSLLKALNLSLATKDRLGEVMIRLKLMTPSEVEKWVKLQVKEIVCTIFNWTRGQYLFEERPAPGESITLGAPGDVAVIEGVRRISSWARVYEEVGGLNTEYRCTKEMPSLIQSLPLLPDERALLEMCDAPMSLDELCQSSKLSDYDVCRSVWALLVVGALMKS